MRWILHTLAFLAATALLGGCAGYRLGPTGELPYRTVFVAPPVNETTLPQIEAPISSALRQAIEQSGQLSIADRDVADTVLTLRLVELKRERQAVESSDLGRARKNLLRLEFSLTLRRAGENGPALIENRRLFVSQEVYNDSGQIEAEWQATPVMAEKVARAALATLVDTW